MGKMKAVVTCEENGTRFYLSVDGCATDISDRAMEFRDLTDASLRAISERRDRAWQTQKWEPAYLMANGQVAIP